MRKLYQGKYYHYIDIPVLTSSDYFMSRDNKVIRVKFGKIYEVKPQIRGGVRSLEVTVQDTYNPFTGNSTRKVFTYNRLYAKLFFPKKKFFALREIDGIPTPLSKEEYAKLSLVPLKPYSGLRQDSNSAIKAKDLPKVRELRKTHTLKELGAMYNCSPTSISRALKNQ